MASTSMLFLAAALLCTAVMGDSPTKEEPLTGKVLPGIYPGHGVYPGVVPVVPRPCHYTCLLRACDLYQCHYRCAPNPNCPLIAIAGRKGGTVNVSKPLKEKVDSFDYVPPQ
ncbi:uncharacterized protein LOC144100232 [Amblyomma americanum]